MNTFDPEPKNTPFKMEHDFPKIDLENLEYLFKTDDFVIVENFLSSNTCKEIRRWVDAHNETFHVKWSNTKNKKIARMYDFPFSNEILTYLPKIIEKEWECEKLNDCWRFVGTSQNASLKDHFDAKYTVSVDKQSKYTIMIYLSEHTEDGTLVIKSDKGDVRIQPKEGLLVIFNQNLEHRGENNKEPKYFMRSEVMYHRTRKSEKDSDKEAMNYYNQAVNLFYENPAESIKLEKRAFELSPSLENIII